MTTLIILIILAAGGFAVFYYFSDMNINIKKDTDDSIKTLEGESKNKDQN